MPRALLMEADLIFTCVMNAVCGVWTHLHKVLEGRIISHFVNDAILGDGIVRNVLHVLITPVERSVEDRSCDTVNDRMLVTLDGMEAIKQLAVLCVQRAEVVIDVRDEGRQPIARDDGWFCRAQWLYVHLQSDRGSNRM
jgi:hypothetical protein